MKVENTLDKRFQKQGKLKVVHGTVLNPEANALRFVLSVNNMAGKADGPLFALFDKKWVAVRKHAKGWYANKTGAYKIGAIEELPVQSDVWVIPMLCANENGEVDVEGLKVCLSAVAKKALWEKASCHISSLLIDMIPELPELIQSHLIEAGVSVCVYEEN
jgi:hypothetical protein